MRLTADAFNTSARREGGRPGVHVVRWITRDRGTMRSRIVVTPDKAIEALRLWRPSSKRPPVYHRIMVFLADVAADNVDMLQGAEMEDGNELHSDGEVREEGNDDE